MKLYLMRHGETDYNKKRCFYGAVDVSINQKGRKQALQIKELLADQEVDVIITSSLKRTQETAQLIFGTRKFQKIPAFDEKGFGAWEGLTADEIQERDSKTWQAWMEAPFEITPQGAESFADFQKRVFGALDRLLSEYSDKSLALVLHLGVLRLIYQHLIDEKAVFWDLDFPQATVTCLEHGTDKQWKISLLDGKKEEDGTTYPR